MHEMQFTPQEQTIIKRDVLQKESENLRKLRQKKGTKDYEPLKIIARGAFGVVRACRDKATGEIVAIKKMSKTEMSKKMQIGHTRAERDVLSCVDNPWIVELKQSFQDEEYLYLVMEYLSGGGNIKRIREEESLPKWLMGLLFMILFLRFDGRYHE